MNENLYETLSAYYRNPLSMRNLWNKKECFSNVLSSVLSVELDCSARTMFHHYVDYFLNYTNIFLMKKNEDFLQLFCEIKDENIIAKFMDQYFKNDLISYEMVCKILDDEELMKKIGSYDDWIEYPLMLRIEYLISISEDAGLSEKDIIPCGLELGSLEEYLLSWAFEEKKLSKTSIEYFKNNFSEKYDRLCDIMDIGE